jgi:hypothetical protein
MVNINKLHNTLKKSHDLSKFILVNSARGTDIFDPVVPKLGDEEICILQIMFIEESIFLIEFVLKKDFSKSRMLKPR